MKIERTEPLKTLETFTATIAKDSELYATSFVERIILAAEKLADFPRLGRMVPEADQENIRELLYQTTASSTASRRNSLRF